MKAIRLILALLLCAGVVCSQVVTVHRYKATGTPFSPTDIAGLKLWLKADSLSLNDGDAVGTWTDSSGQGNNATESTNKPTYKTNIQNGKPAVQFDATDDGMVTSCALPEPYTIFLVEKPVTTNSTGNLRRTIQSTSGNSLIAVGRTANALTCYLNGIVSSYSPNDTNCHLSVLRNTGTVSTYWIDTTDRTTDSTKHAAFSNVALGIRGAFAEPANSNVLEVIAYDSALSTADRQSVETYLNDKYAIY